MSFVQYGESPVRTVWRYFHGFTFNTTPGSRAALSSVSNDTIKPGFLFCYDAEAGTDAATLPSGMLLNGQSPTSFGSSDFEQYLTVCKPTTGVLDNPCGFLVGADVPGGLTPAGLRPDKTRAEGGYKGGVWLEFQIGGPMLGWVVGDLTSAGRATLLGPTDGSWAAGILAVGTNGANLPRILAKPLNPTNLSSAALTPIAVGPLGNLHV